MLESISKPISIFDKGLNRIQNQYQYFKNVGINFKTNTNILQTRDRCAALATRAKRTKSGKVPISGDHPEAKTFPTVPQTCSYIAQATGFLVADAEFNRDASNRAVDGSSVN